jgi:uncharacterized protein
MVLVMSRPYLIIDGYNFMHAAGFARRRYGPGQLERCRLRLLKYLTQHLTEHERERTTIVFDAGGAPPDLARRAILDRMTVCFASPGQEADDDIEELVAAHSSPRQVRLVSSDHRLQKCARRRRGTFVDSDEFFDELERRGPISTTAVRPDGGAAGTGRIAEKPASESETSEWLRLFGDVLPPERETASDNPISAADLAAIKKEVEQLPVVPKSRAAKRRARKDV